MKELVPKELNPEAKAYVSLKEIKKDCLNFDNNYKLLDIDNIQKAEKDFLLLEQKHGQFLKSNGLAIKFLVANVSGHFLELQNMLAEDSNLEVSNFFTLLNFTIDDPKKVLSFLELLNKKGELNPETRATLSFVFKNLDVFINRNNVTNPRDSFFDFYRNFEEIANSCNKLNLNVEAQWIRIFGYSIKDGYYKEVFELKNSPLEFVYSGTSKESFKLALMEEDQEDSWEGEKLFNEEIFQSFIFFTQNERVLNSEVFRVTLLNYVDLLKEWPKLARGNKNILSQMNNFIDSFKNLLFQLLEKDLSEEVRSLIKRESERLVKFVL